MQTVTSRFARPQPRPALVLTLCFGLVTTIAAALAPLEGFTSPAEPNVAPILSFEREIEVLPAEDLLTVSFSLPVSDALPAPGPGLLADPVALDPEAVLRAIAEVESAGNPSRVGRLGERGLYQFRRATWRQHTREDFRRAHHPEISTTVARRHYQWLTRELRARGYQATAYEVALAWNAGLSRVLSGQAPSRAHHYAQRVANLANPS